MSFIKHTNRKTQKIRLNNYIINRLYSAVYYDTIIPTRPHELAAATVRCDNTITANVGNRLRQRLQTRINRRYDLV